MPCRPCLALLLVVAAVEAFAPLSSIQSPISSSTTGLNLKPIQGSQLVAAWNAAHPEVEEEDEESYSSSLASKSNISPPTTPTSAARAFVSRLFHLPSAMAIRRQHHAAIEQDDEDVVYYPIVGFRYCKTDASHSMAVPTSNCNASIRLHPSLEQEPVYGWFTASCPLGNLDADDYCSEPQATEEVLNLAP